MSARNAMSPTKRRVIQALLYEAIAVGVVGPILALIFDEPAASAIALALLMSLVALAWNYLFNALFERWESRQPNKGRSMRRRIAHGLGFEGGLVVMLVPVTAWWLDISWLQALITEAGILLFFFLYAVIFHWAFDAIFGLPESARHECNA